MVLVACHGELCMVQSVESSGSEYRMLNDDTGGILRYQVGIESVPEAGD